MATQISMLITLLLATGATASAPDVTPMQQKATLESDTNQQCDTVNELSGAANSASGRFQGEEELNLLQERILVHSAHAAHSRNGATLSASGTPPANFSSSSSLVDRSNASNRENQTISLEEKTENKLPVGEWGGWFQGPIIKWHPACRWPFAHLYPYFGSSGDLCYHPLFGKTFGTWLKMTSTELGLSIKNWFCPDGCTGAGFSGTADSADQVEQVPYCIQGGKRDSCEVEECPTTMWSQDGVDTGDNTKIESELVQGARRCRMTADKEYIVPRGCKWGKPPGWSYSTSVDEKDPSKLCRVSEATPVDPTGMWTLVGTKNGEGDIHVEIEVGFVSSQSKATTKEESTRFMTQVEASVSHSVGVNTSFGGAKNSGSLGSSVSFERTNTMVETVKSASESSSTHTVNIKCPGRLTNGRIWTVWVYQWQISNSQAALKSEHFRCHYSIDGYERAPQCPPNACGMPTLNPYCLAAPEEMGDGAGKDGYGNDLKGSIDTKFHLVDGSEKARDPSCVRHAPTKPGCWVYHPRDCGITGFLGGNWQSWQDKKGWSLVGGSTKEDEDKAQRDSWYCEVKTKQFYHDQCKWEYELYGEIPSLVTHFIPHSELPDSPGCWVLAPGCKSRYVKDVGYFEYSWFKEVTYWPGTSVVKEDLYTSKEECEVGRKDYWQNTCNLGNAEVEAKFFPYPNNGNEWVPLSYSYPYPFTSAKVAKDGSAPAI